MSSVISQEVAMNPAGRRVHAALTILGLLMAALGGLAELALSRFQGSFDSYDRYAGLTGAIVGYLAGLVLVAWCWPSHRRTPAVGRRVVGSVGQRLFALCAWGLLGVALITFAIPFSAEVFAPINALEAVPLPPDDRPWLEWKEASMVRARRAGAAGAGVAGALLVLAASWLGPRPLIRRRPATLAGLDTDDGAIQTAATPTTPRWGPVSLAVGLVANGLGFLAVLMSYSPLRSYSPSRITVAAECVCFALFAIGTGAAAVANWRNERRFLVTCLGFLLNAWLLVFFLLPVLHALADRAASFSYFVYRMFVP
jgi:hypothetical protein